MVINTHYIHTYAHACTCTLAHAHMQTHTCTAQSHTMQRHMVLLIGNVALARKILSSKTESLDQVSSIVALARHLTEVNKWKTQRSKVEGILFASLYHSSYGIYHLCTYTYI